MKTFLKHIYFVIILHTFLYYFPLYGDTLTSYDTDTVLQKDTNDILQELPRLIVSPKQPLQDAFRTNKSEFDEKELLQTAGTGNDINRIIALHPAVASTNTIDDNSISVRSGKNSENIYLVDGIEVRTINHFASEKSSGAFGFLPVDMVHTIKVHTVVQPRLPARNSSAIEIFLKNHSNKKINGQVDLNISGLSLQMNGANQNQKLFYLTNIRWNDMEPLKPFLRDGAWSQFGDIILKGTVSLTDNHTIGTTSLISYDKYRSTAFWDENYPDARYMKELVQVTSGIYSHYNKGHFSHRINCAIRYYNDYFIQDFEQTYYYPILKKNVSYNMKLQDSKENKRNLTIANSLQLHTSTKMFTFETGLRGTVEDFTFHKYYPVKGLDSAILSYEAGGYFQGDLRLGRFTVSSGLRGNYFSDIKELGVAPFLGIVMNCNSSGLLALQCGYTYQVPPVVDEQLPWIYLKHYKIKEFELQRCFQTSLLYDLSIRQKHAFSAEAYVKYYNQDYAYSEPYKIPLINARRVPGNKFVYSITKADGTKYSVGLELDFHNTVQKSLRYQFIVALSKTRDKYTNGSWYNNQNDIRINSKLTSGITLGKHHDIAVALLANEGRPYSTLNEYSRFQDFDTYQSPWFIKRFDPTFFLSARYTFSISGKRTKFSGYLDIQNILNQTHAIAMQEVDVYSFAEKHLNGILPTAGLTWVF